MLPEIQYVKKLADLDTLLFVDDVAKIMVPVGLVDRLPFKNEFRGDSARYRDVLNAIRRHGYNNFDPIVVRLGRRGRWVIVDGGHRLMAAQKVSKEFLTNLFGRKVRDIYFVLFRTPLTNTRIDEAPDEAA